MMIYPGSRMTKKDLKGNYSVSHKILIIKTYNSVLLHLRATQFFKSEVGDSES